jgi:hypothetical protein
VCNIERSPETSLDYAVAGPAGFAFSWISRDEGCSSFPIEHATFFARDPGESMELLFVYLPARRKPVSAEAGRALGRVVDATD